MGIGDKMKGFLEQSAQTSKELASKAGAKAQNLGEQGVLLLDIKKAKGQIEKLLNSLGREVFQIFTVQNIISVASSDEPVKKILDEIAELQSLIARKEAELQEKKAQ